jgi:hypothetical protein
MKKAQKGLKAKHIARKMEILLLGLDLNSDPKRGMEIKIDCEKMVDFEYFDYRHFRLIYLQQNK